MISRRLLRFICIVGCFVVFLWFPKSRGRNRVRLDKRFKQYGSNSIAIATTVLNPDPSFPVWLEYHLRRVDLIIIFMDEPDERPLFESLTRDKPVLLFNGSEAEPDMSPGSRVIYRQEENTNAALHVALENQITWLMHIDPDELFYDNGNWTWQTWQHIGMVQFDNVEAVFLPYEVENFFDDCKLFRKDGGFSAYGHGKSAVRVSPDVHASGPHEFWGYENESIIVEEPLILHYPTPTFQRWVDKYKFYGNFSNYWFDTSGDTILTFMQESRDALQASLRDGNMDEARNYYHSWIPTPGDIARWVESGGMLRISPLGKD